MLENVCYIMVVWLCGVGGPGHSAARPGPAMIDHRLQDKAGHPLPCRAVGPSQHQHTPLTTSVTMLSQLSSNAIYNVHPAAKCVLCTGSFGRSLELVSQVGLGAAVGCAGWSAELCPASLINVAHKKMMILAAISAVITCNTNRHNLHHSAAVPASLRRCVAAGNGGAGRIVIVQQ